MRLVMYTAGHAPRLGVVWTDRVIDLNRTHRTFLAATGDDCESAELADALVPADSLAYLRGGRRSAEAAAACLQWVVEQLERAGTPQGPWQEQLVRPLSGVRLKAPVLHPRKIICLGLNYRDHAEEQGAKIPKNPILFGKYDRSLIGHGEDIEYPAVTEQLDYEAELAVVIGRSGRHIAKRDALSHVAGYAAFNDVTSRDVQFADRQWLRGKMGDAHAPFGPWLVTADEIADPQALGIRLWLNGELLQDSSTSELIFGIAELVSFISASVTLDVGDVIATGTPSGVGFARKPPVFMAPDDVVRVEVDGIGVLENRVVKA
jgi:2-keto-4-pentenoate hydratase/2-oxohepta-3-ene-1,7-dioic acid hydratase in catechol pathway